jgi:aconitase B
VINVKESIKSMEVSNLTFDKLFELIEENRFANEIDKKIAEKILNAEKDWWTSIKTLNDFIEILKKEINGQPTKSNLNKLLNRI